MCLLEQNANCIKRLKNREQLGICRCKFDYTRIFLEKLSIAISWKEKGIENVHPILSSFCFTFVKL